MNTVGADDDFGNDTSVPRVLASKLMPPGDSPTHLDRPHLVDAMYDAQTARLVLIRAGAGFGKTTLMQQYTARCRAAQRRLRPSKPPRVPQGAFLITCWSASLAARSRSRSCSTTSKRSRAHRYSISCSD
jgi:hypothetical protein